ncbi:MAG: hypothetical protein AAGA03_04175 [Planctomycetota bacterium]
MSSANPYESASTMAPPLTPPGIRHVQVRPIELLQRGYEFIKPNYWLFLGIVFVGVLIGSIVPFQILMGTMLLGMFTCMMFHEQGRKVEFGDLFKGFDNVGDSIIAWLIILGSIFLMVIPLVIVLFVCLGAVVAITGADGPGIAVGMLVFYPLLILASCFVYVPFLFMFPLMAEYKLPPMQALKLSWAGAKANLFGLFKYVLVISLVSFIAALACYIPAILLSPISFASLFLLYRDVYERQLVTG